MTTHLVQVGNSLGLRIPKAIIAQLGFDAHTQLSFKVTKQGLLVSAIRPCREGWAKAFQAVERQSATQPMLELTNQFDLEEWEW